MTGNTTNSNRIAKNTMFLLVRMVVLMFISFFTSRIILHSLGIIDYGICNVVGGLAAMFIFFRSSLANVTQRYLNMALGQGDIAGARNVFCLHQTLYIAIALVTILVSETLGLWIVCTQLDIPVERLNAAMWVFHFTVIALATTIVSVVFDSTLIAHENMKVYSYVGIFEGLFKLLVAYIVSIATIDKLITYQLLLMVLAILLWVFYALYCRYRYAECRYRFYWNRDEARKAGALVSWNTVGTIAWAFNEHGLNILLNLFFGPAVNAARGVAYQVSIMISNYGQNFLVSLQPQITKSYASGDIESVNKLFFAGSKLSVLLLWAFCLPVMLCVDFLLHLWLKEVPEYAGVFIVWMLAMYMVNTLSNPVWFLALAVGKLKKYVLVGSTIFFMAFPMSYVCLKLGASPTSVFVCLLVARVAYYLAEFTIVRGYVDIPLSDYIAKVIAPIAMVIVTSWGASYGMQALLPDTFMGNASVILFSLVMIAASTYCLGLSNEERNKARSWIKRVTRIKKQD
ncbi:MAG: hypothetical protein KBT09_00875 [Bacteroidales bacterium]|nr:hypothetical protein [Candidatus Sodaliphilus fimicaballi]